MSTNYNELRDVLRNLIEIKELLDERKQIEADYHKDTTYNKLDYTPKPSWAKKLPPRTYKLDKSKDKKSREKRFKEQLDQNAKKIEKVAHDHCKEMGGDELVDKLKEFSTNELPTFIEKGRDEVINNRKLQPFRENKNDIVRYDKRIKQNKTLDQSQEVANDSLEYHKERNSSEERIKKTNSPIDQLQNQEKLQEQNNKFDQSQEIPNEKLKDFEEHKLEMTNNKLDQAYEKLRESQFKENQNEIEQKRDRGFKR